MNIRKRVRKSGTVRWEFSYTDRGGKRRAPNFATRREADEALSRIVSELRGGVHTPDSASITIAQAGDLWITRCEKKPRRLEPTTIKQYREHLRLHIVPLMGAQKLSRLSSPLVEAFADRLAATLSEAMAKKVMVSFKSLMREAQRRGLVATSAAAPVKIETSARHEERVRIPTKAEVQAMLQKVTELRPRWRPLLATAILTGLRASELRGLTWDAIDLDRRVLQVRQRADAYGSIGAPKSKAGRREIPLSPMVVNTLREWKVRCPKGPLGLAFPTTEGGVMHQPDILRLCWYPLLIACGFVEAIGVAKKGKPRLAYRYEFHALRHVAASLWIEQGATPKRIQVAMGHSSIKVTFDVYGHLFADADADQALVAGAEKALFL
jgi:integrase